MDDDRKRERVDAGSPGRVEGARPPPSREDRGFSSVPVPGFPAGWIIGGMRDGGGGFEGEGEGCRWGVGGRGAAGRNR